MTLVTTIGCTGLIDQLADELVVSYSAVDLTITQIVTALLALQVLTPPITVGTIDPVVSRTIDVDGDTILRAIYRLRDTVGGHIYVDSNRALQWRTTIGEDKGQQIRYRKNLMGITRDVEYATLANRIYAYGAGEGEARIKLSDADGQVEDYVEDTDSQAEWGGTYIVTIVDQSITHPDTLLAWANLKLADLKDPRIAYEVDTVDFSAVAEIDLSFDALQIGSIVTIIDEDLGIDVSAQVVKITRPDLRHPEQMRIEVANRIRDITDILGDIHDTVQLRQHIATAIGAGQVIVKGAFTVIDWVTEGQTTIVGDNIETGTITADRLNANVLVAGNILISGLITLEDWASDTDPEKFDGAVIYTGTIDKTGLNFSAFDTGVNTLDDMADGATYSRVNTVDITAGSVKLSSVVQASGYRTVSDGEKGTWNGKPDNIDQLGDGVSYKKVLATDVSAGHIKLSSVTVIDGEWYDEAGVEIDATHGINIYGSSSAFTTRATKAGTIQCYVGSDGKIYAGAGIVSLGSAGITVKGQSCIFNQSDGTYRGRIHGIADTFSILAAPSTSLFLYSGVSILTQGNIIPNTGSTWDIGASGTRYDNVHTNHIWVNNHIYLFDDLYPNSDNASTSLGFAARYNLQVYANFIRYKDLASFDVHDDIALLQGIKTKTIIRRGPSWLDKNGVKRRGVEKEAIVLDGTSLPKDVFQDGFFDSGGLTGLLLGAIKQLVERVEALEGGQNG